MSAVRDIYLVSRRFALNAGVMTCHRNIRNEWMTCIFDCAVVLLLFMPSCYPLLYSALTLIALIWMFTWSGNSLMTTVVHWFHWVTFRCRTPFSDLSLHLTDPDECPAPLLFFMQLLKFLPVCRRLWWWDTATRKEMSDSMILFPATSNLSLWWVRQNLLQHYDLMLFAVQVGY